MYELVYGYNGKVSSIQKGNMSIPICPTVLALDSEGNKYVLQAGNIDYLEFLEWNKEQKTPLDLKSTIPVIPPVPPRDLAGEVDTITTFIGLDVVPPHSTISAVVISIASDKLSCEVRRVYQGIDYDFKALITTMVADRLGKNTGVNVGDTVIVTYLDHAPIGTLPIIVDKIAAVIYPL